MFVTLRYLVWTLMSGPSISHVTFVIISLFSITCSFPITAISLQAVTLFFYILALVVILQRVWSYIGCIICI